MKSYWTIINLGVIRSSETSGTICQPTWRRVLEDLYPNPRRAVEVQHVPIQRKQQIYVNFFVSTHVRKLPLEGMSRLLVIYQRIWN
jgi:hypothetical protein